MLNITDLAKTQVLAAIQEEDRGKLALRVAILGRGPGGFQYKMDLIEQDEKLDDDLVQEEDGFQIFVDQESAKNLDGATIDFVQKLQEAGFKFENPNSAWSDPKAVEIQEIIDKQINPQIAAHGGYVTLLDVKDNTVYISMGGGCQGCGMADVTLKHGVETTIRELVPDIEQVLDTTDHAAGTNPYYAG